MIISIEEFKSFLGPKFTLLDDNASKREYVFEMKIDNTNLVIKVFSSISKESDQDAHCPIRVVVIDIVQKIGWLKTQKVLKNENWQPFLTKTINRCIDDSLFKLEEFKKSISLREINLKLAQSTFNLSQIWTSTPDFFSTTVPLLDKFKQQRRRDSCPKCNRIYTTKNMIRLLQAINFDINGIQTKTETLGWTFQCPHCQSLLKISAY